MKLTFEAKLTEVHTEDGGCAKMGVIEDKSIPDLFLRIQSWNEEHPPKHEIFDRLSGKTLRVTIQIL